MQPVRFRCSEFHMRRPFLAITMLATVIGMAPPVSGQTVGVVLMHGNTDSPSGTIAPLAAALEGAGYLVERPEMCWSFRRKRDRPFLDCLAELDAPIAQLAGRGASAIVVAGMSQGGAAALAFGATRSGLTGIIALGANGDSGRLIRLFPQIAQSITEARAMATAGRGDERATFSDLNIHGPFPVETTAAIYLSFFDPAGPSNMRDNVSHLRAPLLWVAGLSDRSQFGSEGMFGSAPFNPMNRYVTVDSDHLGTPTAAREAVISWLRELQ